MYMKFLHEDINCFSKLLAAIQLNYCGGEIMNPSIFRSKVYFDPKILKASHYLAEIFWSTAVPKMLHVTFQHLLQYISCIEVKLVLHTIHKGLMSGLNCVLYRTRVCGRIMKVDWKTWNGFHSGFELGPLWWKPGILTTARP